MVSPSRAVALPRARDKNVLEMAFGGVIGAVGSTARFAQAATLGAANLFQGAFNFIWKLKPQPSLIEYPTNYEPTKIVDEDNREPGKFSIKFAELAVRMSIFAYLESGLYWKSDKRPVEHFSVTRPSEQSIGMLLVENRFPSLFYGIYPDFIGPEYDRVLSKGRGKISSGLIKEYETDTDLIVMHDVAAETIYIVWQGTQSRTDMKTDVAFLPRYWPYRHKDGKRLYASRGFVRSHESVSKDLIAVVKEMWSTGKYKKIFCAGHSLGGILAHLNAHAMSYAMEEELEATGLRPEERLVCYTIGSPKGMTWDLRNDYFRRVPHTYRMRNDEDIVPRLPVPMRHHVGIPVLMDELHFLINFDEERTVLTADKENIGETISDHNTGNYLSNLLGLKSRLRVSAEKSDALERAYVSMVQLDREYEWEVLMPTEKSKEKEVARYVKPGVDPVSLNAEATEIIRKAYGSAVSDDILNHLVYYGSKLVESHDFNPRKNGFDAEPVIDVQELHINIFRMAFCELVLDKDKDRNLKRVQYRLVFDKHDWDKDGLLSPMEFLRIAKALNGEKLPADLEDDELVEMLHVEFRKLYQIMNEPYPVDPAMELRTVSFAEFYVWAELNGHDLAAIQAV
mmetsp:Transcript_43275/g.169369  ORF Transcript_43275/g.169369 Transcript_43275/m.169369 type:complete len:624 (+) Transcript_43275:287-2158(+)|eukprot:CAMPEP_0113956298 /NCGR_PEP_ID=MMETSP0011_2-20120614/1965_1 /TAXON_ID=101924 /ORGANISM="Rhodosorus marinus" /LENGTH=623 /DNA_ID=CAMNT_0000966391 /DNA_START=151 /DNA_END=2022 /DNA_ORIENTATION=- /assembly_acc=CAM_ASM_000156